MGTEIADEGAREGHDPMKTGRDSCAMNQRPQDARAAWIDAYPHPVASVGKAPSST